MLLRPRQQGGKTKYIAAASRLSPSPLGRKVSVELPPLRGIVEASCSGAAIGRASRSPGQARSQGHVTGPPGRVPMPVRAVDDKPSDTLVWSPAKVLDGEFDSPPSPPPRIRQPVRAWPTGVGDDSDGDASPDDPPHSAACTKAGVQSHRDEVEAEIEGRDAAGRGSPWDCCSTVLGHRRIVGEGRDVHRPCRHVGLPSTACS